MRNVRTTCVYLILVCYLVAASPVNASVLSKLERVVMSTKVVSTATALGYVLGTTIAKISHNLNFSNVDPTKFQRAGMRDGLRSLSDAKMLWELIPEQVRAAGPAAVNRFLSDKDWSHINPYSKGGSDKSWNGIWEDSSINRSRGNRVMTREELVAAKHALQSGAVDSVIQEAASAALKGAIIGVVVAAVLSILEHGLEYYQGHIDEEELSRRVMKSMLIAGGVGGVLSGILVAVSLSFPAFGIALAYASPVLAGIGVCMLGYRLYQLGKDWYEVLN